MTSRNDPLCAAARAAGLCLVALALQPGCDAESGEVDIGCDAESGEHDVEIARDAAQVSAGLRHTCAVLQDGRLICWGSNDYGQLGTNDDSPRPDPVQEATGARDWLQVSAGDGHTCAVTTDGRLLCWGRGPLGNGEQSGSLVPVQEFTEADDWAQVSAGGYGFTCAVKTDGRLFCWGYGSYGSLGTGVRTITYVPVQEVTEADDWAQVSAGRLHTCAVKTDGRLFCWGYNAFGELGNNDDSHSLEPVQEFTQEDWAQVAAGGYHTCAVKTDGQLFCWGGDIRGVLGAADTSDDRGSLVPMQEGSRSRDWAQVAGSRLHTCAAQSDGRVSCWGGGCHTPNRRFTGASDWIQVAVGDSETCALSRDGLLVCRESSTL
jgi:alpha-tubulin suppressor-like RCC1 family protein